MSRVEIDWTGRKLGYLLFALEQALRPRPDRPAPTAALTRLPRGAVIELSIREDGRKQLRIGRTTRPDSDKGLKAWGVELQIFAKELGISDWTPTTAEARAPGIAAAFIEPAPKPAVTEPLELPL